MAEETEDLAIYEVVLNHEEQYSIWPEFKGEPPSGWRTVGKKGLKPECLDYIKGVWTDMRPLSLRKKMEEWERRKPELEAEEARLIEAEAKKPKDPRDNLVHFLSQGTHPAEPGLRPEKSLKLFKEAIDRGYVHIKFTDTRGGTELGVRLDPGKCDLSKADFINGSGAVHLEGGLVLNYVKVTCISDIQLSELKGFAKLEIINEAENQG